jgi:hypothetical protein
MLGTKDGLVIATTVVTALIGLVALFRPGIGDLLWRRRAMVDLHPAARLGVGFP